MRARPAIVLALIVLLAGGIAWLVAGSPAPSAPSAAPAGDASAGAAADPARGNMSAVAATAAVPTVDDAPALAQRVAAAAGAGAAGPIVRVLRRDDGGDEHPVVGITVAWVADGEADARARADQLLDAPHEWPQRYGGRAVTDGIGAVRLPPVTRLTAVTAFGDGLFAFRFLDAGEPQCVLHVVPDETVAIEVRTTADAPAADVPVAIRMTWAKGERELWRGRTDAQGRAVAAHFQQIRPALVADERFFVGVDGAFADAADAAARFAGRPAPTEPIRLRIGTLRPLAATVLYADGAPVRAALELVVGQALGGDGRDANRFGARAVRKGDGPEAVDLGLAATDRALPLAFALPRGERPQPGTPLPDLRVPAGTGPATATVRLPDAVRALAFTLHDPEGRPLAAALAWQLRRERDGAQVAGRVLTDRDGRGEFLLPDDAATDPATLTLLRGEPAEPASARAQLGAVARSERRDLGTLVLQAAPLLAQGRVVDDLGAPRPRVEVTVQVAGDPAPNGGATWTDAPSLTATTDADGAFAFFAPAPPRAFRLVVGPTGDHFVGASAPLTAGSRVEIVTPRAGILTGEIRLAAELAPDQVVLQMTPTAPVAGAASARSHSAPLHRNGFFWFGGLPAGDYTLTVRGRWLTLPLARFDGVRIAPGENTDPRLQPLDLAAQLRRFRLRAVAADGAPLADAAGAVRWRAPSQGEWTTPWSLFPWRDGAVDVFLPTARAEFVVVAPGAAPRSVMLDAGAHDVVVADARPVVFGLPGARATLGSERAFRLCAEWRGEGPAGTTGEAVDGASSLLDADDRATLRLAQAGRYALSLRAEGGPAGSSIPTADLGVLEVTLAPGAVHAVAVDLAALAKALRDGR
ncbi:MAG: hypothetical protein ACK57Q_07640 [Planctomycetota bacterium]